MPRVEGQQAAQQQAARATPSFWDKAQNLVKNYVVSVMDDIEEAAEKGAQGMKKLDGMVDEALKPVDRAIALALKPLDFATQEQVIAETAEFKELMDKCHAPLKKLQTKLPSLLESAQAVKELPKELPEGLEEAALMLAECELIAQDIIAGQEALNQRIKGFQALRFKGGRGHQYTAEENELFKMAKEAKMMLKETKNAMAQLRASKDIIELAKGEKKLGLNEFESAKAIVAAAVQQNRLNAEIEALEELVKECGDSSSFLQEQVKILEDVNTPLANAVSAVLSCNHPDIVAGRNDLKETLAQFVESRQKKISAARGHQSPKELRILSVVQEADKALKKLDAAITRTKADEGTLELCHLFQKAQEKYSDNLAKFDDPNQEDEGLRYVHAGLVDVAVRNQGGLGNVIPELCKPSENNGFLKLRVPLCEEPSEEEENLANEKIGQVIAQGKAYMDEVLFQSASARFYIQLTNYNEMVDNYEEIDSYHNAIALQESVVALQETYASGQKKNWNLDQRNKVDMNEIIGNLEIALERQREIRADIENSIKNIALSLPGMNEYALFEHKLNGVMGVVEQVIKAHSAGLQAHAEKQKKNPEVPLPLPEDLKEVVEWASRCREECVKLKDVVNDARGPEAAAAEGAGPRVGWMSWSLDLLDRMFEKIGELVVRLDVFGLVFSEDD